MAIRMRDFEWDFINSPNKSRGVKRVERSACDQWHFVPLALAFPWRVCPNSMAKWSTIYVTDSIAWCQRLGISGT